MNMNKRYEDEKQELIQNHDNLIKEYKQYSERKLKEIFQQSRLQRAEDEEGQDRRNKKA